MWSSVPCCVPRSSRIGIAIGSTTDESSSPFASASSEVPSASASSEMPSAFSPHRRDSDSPRLDSTPSRHQRACLPRIVAGEPRLSCADRRRHASVELI
ncbi:hypothetical protein CLOP_g11388 [Closterium sp. NIES-67]|nr:hypothetical protein CLOP_g11388 [Closterium sp. NIES-67]